MIDPRARAKVMEKFAMCVEHRGILPVNAGNHRRDHRSEQLLQKWLKVLHRLHPQLVE